MRGDVGARGERWNAQPPERGVAPVRAQSLPRTAYVVVGIVTLLRLIAAAYYPLTEDEAYYWSWSRHLAFGYLDHPPAVAFVAALLAPLGSAPLAIRAPFVLCEAVAALAVGRAALTISGEARAGAAGTIAFALVPQLRLAIGEALPDGPYLLSWTLTIAFAAAAFARPSRAAFAGLGIALGGAILSRVFGFALVAGIVASACVPLRRDVWRGGLWISFAIAAAMYAPFLAWNATHGWANVAFTFFARQPHASFGLDRLAVVSSVRFLVYALAFWIVGWFVAVRPKRALLAWTALPLPTFLVAFALFQTAESYWLLGPLASLCVGIGIGVARLSPPRRRALAVVAGAAAAYTTATALFVALPERSQATLLHGGGGAFAGSLATDAVAYAPLARDVAHLARERGAAVVTDRYEIAAELAHGGVVSALAGREPQVWQWDQWREMLPDSARAPARALFVQFAATDQRTLASADLERAYETVVAGPRLRYVYAGRATHAFALTWCEHPRPGAARRLFGGALTR